MKVRQSDVEFLQMKRQEFTEIQLKPDEPINQFTEHQMASYERKHLDDLEIFARNCDIEEQKALLRGLDPRLMCLEIYSTLERNFAYQQSIESIAKGEQ